MVKKRKVLTYALCALLCACCALFGVSVTLGEDNRASAESYTEVSVSGSAVSLGFASHPDIANRLTLKIDGSDWGNAPASTGLQSNSNANGLGTFSKITINGVETSKTYDAVSPENPNGADVYFNLFGVDPAAMTIAIYNATQISFPKGTKFPSYDYATNGTGDVYVLSQTVNFTRTSTSSNDWTREVVIEKTYVDLTMSHASDYDNYKNGYNISAINISLGGKNTLPKDGGAGYFVNDHATQNGVDLAEYIYINDVSVRSVLAENATSGKYKHSSSDLFPMNIGGVYAPILVQVDGNLIKLKIMCEYAAAGSFSLTFKTGFVWNNADGETLKVTNDVKYVYEDGNFVKETERDTVIIDDVFSVRATTVDAVDSVIYTIDSSVEFFTDNNWLMDHYTDLQNYIAVNGKTVSEINAETDDSDYSYTEFPGTNGGVFAVPVRVHFGAENGKTRLNVYIHKDYLAVNPLSSIGVKAGFATKDATKIYTVDKDVIFYAYGGAFTRKSTVTFDGEPKDGYIGFAIPESSVPENPVRDSSATVDYVFAGWYNGDVLWDMSAALTGDLELVSVFSESARKYNVTYYNDDDTVYRVERVAYGDTIVIVDLPAKVGYTAEWTANHSYTVMPAEDLSFKVAYTAIEYTITFKADGVVVGESKYTVENKTVTRPEIPAKEGFTAAWESFEPTTGDITVNAVYTKITDDGKESGSSGCSGNADGSVGIVLALCALSVIAIKKKRS